MTTKIDETWGIASPLPCQHIPIRSRPKDQRIVRIMSEIKRDWGFLKHSITSIQKARDSRGFRTESEARESQQRTHGLLAIKCTKNEIEISSNKVQNEEMNWFKPPRGHKEVRASFPNQIHKSSHTNNIQLYPKEMNWGRGTQGRQPGETENSRAQ